MRTDVKEVLRELRHLQQMELFANHGEVEFELREYDVNHNEWDEIVVALKQEHIHDEPPDEKYANQACDWLNKREDLLRELMLALHVEGFGDAR